MATEEKFNSSAIFRGLPEGDKEQLMSICAQWSIKKGQTIFSEGDSAEGFYLVISGLVKIYKVGFDGREQILHLFGEGEIFGEVPVFAGGNYPANAVTLEDSRLLFFPKAEFTQLLKREPQIALNMLVEMSLRLRRFTHLVENLSLKEVPARLAAYILFLCDEEPSRTEVRLEIPKGQLASVLGTIPETLSRILNRFSSQGIIEVRGRTISILDRKRLENLASGTER